MASASDDIKYEVDQLVLTEFPLIYSLSLEKDSRCAGCFKVPKGQFSSGKALKTCAGCGHFKHCSRECQVSDWNKFHKMECKIYAKHGTKLDDGFYPFTLRALLLQQNRPEELERRVKKLDGSERCFNDLVDHQGEFLNNDKEFNKMMRVSSFFASLGVQLHPEVMRQIMIKLMTNICPIYDTSPFGKQIGTGLYLRTSILDQSCEPNSSMIFNGLQMEIRTLKNIPHNEPLTFSLVNTKWPTLSRRTFIYTSNRFICKCPRCLKYENDVDAEASAFPSMVNVNVARMFSLIEKYEPILNEKERIKRHISMIFRGYQFYGLIIP